MNNSKYILLVDDDPDDLMFLREAIESFEDIIIIECPDGISALNVLKDNQQNNNLPCLIVLDINMPILDGREVLAVLKSDPLLKNIPVLVFTTSSNPADINYCSQYGVEMLSKPINVGKLHEMAKKMLGLCHT